MAQQQSKDSQQQARDVQQQRSEKEQKQDIKNAEYIARIDQPNHPNT